MAQIVDYTEQAPGVYRFKLDDGREHLGYGESASDTARRLDALRSMGRGPLLAQNMSAGGQGNVPESRADVPAAMGGGGAPDAMEYDDMPGQATTGQLSQEAPGSISVQMPPPQAQPPRQKAAVEEIPELQLPQEQAPQQAQMPERGRVRVPGYNPMQAAQNAFPVPQTGRRTVERSGEPLSPQDQMDLARADVNIMRQRNAAAEEKALIAEHRVAAATVRSQKLQTQAAAQQAQINTSQRRADEQFAKAEALSKAHAEKKVDPKRIFKGNTFAQIGTIIARALGAFGASLTGGPNYAGELIDLAIDRDIKIQEDEIDRLGEGARNALADFYRDTGNMNQAKLLLRTTMDQVAAQESAAYTALIGSAEAQQANQIWQAEAQKRAMENMIQNRNYGVQKITESVATKFEQPRSGGTRQQTWEEKAKEEEAQTRIYKARQERDPEAAAAAIDKDQYRYGKDRGPLIKAEDTLDKTISLWEAQLEKYGTIPGLDIVSTSEGFAGSVARGTQYIAAELGADESELAINNRQDVNSLRIAAQEALSGIPSDKDQELLDKSFQGAKRPQDYLRRAKQMRDTIRRNRVELDAGAGPGARRRLERNRSTIQRQNPDTILTPRERRAR